jgi:hypothetical protein
VLKVANPMAETKSFAFILRLYRSIWISSSRLGCMFMNR